MQPLVHLKKDITIYISGEVCSNIAVNCNRTASSGFFPKTDLNPYFWG